MKFIALCESLLGFSLAKQPYMEHIKELECNKCLNHGDYHRITYAPLLITFHCAVWYCLAVIGVLENTQDQDIWSLHLKPRWACSSPWPLLCCSCFWYLLTTCAGVIVVLDIKVVVLPCIFNCATVQPTSPTYCVVEFHEFYRLWECETEVHRSEYVV